VRRAVTLPPSCAESCVPQTPGTHWACKRPVQGLLYILSAVQEPGWVPESVWMGTKKGKSAASKGVRNLNRPDCSLSVTDYAITDSTEHLPPKHLFNPLKPNDL
jgi:hypothetical protein